MFDWNDEELTDIIWGEAEEVGDHIVPYPDVNLEKHSDKHGNHVKKEKNEEAVVLKPLELKKSLAESNPHGVKVESGPEHDRSEGLESTGYHVDSWPDISLPGSETLLDDAEGSEAFKKVSDISRDEPRSDHETAAVDTKIFQSTLDNSEQSDFVDYGWASVGSFEDLDRIFSNEDQLFGNANLDNSEELWTSGRDVTSSPEKSIFLKIDSPSLGISPPRSIVDKFEVKAEFPSGQNRPCPPAYEKLNFFASSSSQDNNCFVETTEYPDGESKLYKNEKTALEIDRSDHDGILTLCTGYVAAPKGYMNKGNQQKKLLKGQSQNKECKDLTESGDQFAPLHTPYVPEVRRSSSSLGFSHQMPLEGLTPSQYKNLSHPLNPFTHANAPTQYEPSLCIKRFPCEVRQQPTLPGYEISHGTLDPFHQAVEVPLNSLRMTPQEKIEKLRRRQQMRAMLAIQKQQQQFGSGESSSKYSDLEAEISDAEAENLSVFPSDANSPIEHDFSNEAGTGPDEGSVANLILYQLQHTIAKLNMQIRLRIRDSLFRLADSAAQRQYDGDTGSIQYSRQDELQNKEDPDVHTRSLETSDAETETNPIDRTVARLLFHRPLEFSDRSLDALESPVFPKLPHSGIKSSSSLNLHGTIESPTSAKGLIYERKSGSSMSISTNTSDQKSENDHILSGDELKVHCSFPEGDILKSLSHVNSSETTLISRSAPNGEMKVEISR